MSALKIFASHLLVNEFPKFLFAHPLQIIGLPSFSDEFFHFLVNTRFVIHGGHIFCHDDSLFTDVISSITGEVFCSKASCIFFLQYICLGMMNKKHFVKWGKNTLWVFPASSAVYCCRPSASELLRLSPEIHVLKCPSKQDI